MPYDGLLSCICNRHMGDAHIAKHYSMGVDDEGNPVVLRDYRHRNEWMFISWNL